MWIESHVELGTHPKLKRLARRLGVALPQAVGHLHYLWWWAIRYAPDGCLKEWDNEEVADAASWNGNADDFMTAMVSSGFIDSASRRLHDWQDYGEKLHVQRQLRAERNRRYREKATQRNQGQTSEDDKQDVSETSSRRATGQDKTRHDSTRQDIEESTVVVKKSGAPAPALSRVMDTDIKTVWDYYCQEIKAGIMEPRDSIRRLLGVFTVEQLKQAIDNTVSQKELSHKENYFWRMAKAKPAGWFFGDAERIEEMLLIPERAKSEMTEDERIAEEMRIKYAAFQ